MKQFDLTGLNKAISTQYNDYKGLVAIDTHDGSGLFDLAKDFGIDTKKWFVYGASCYDSEPIGKHELSISMLLIDKDIYGSSFDDISKRNDTIPLVERRISVPYSDLGKYIKRVNIGVVSSLSAHITVSFPDEL
jgi:hypothetical protein